MGVAYNSKIVTDGLILNLDAGNPRSYPGSGNTWYDLSGRGNHGNIQSGVSYSNGSFNFTLNSSNQLITIAHSDDFNYSYLNWAYSLWVKINFDDDGIWTQLFIKGNDSGNRRPGVWFIDGQTDKLHLTWNASGDSQIDVNSSSVSTQPIGEWTNFVFQSRNGVSMIYKNTVMESNTATLQERATSSDPLTIGYSNVSYRSPGMDLAIFQCYNKSLSDSEISQNFNAFRGRFGI